MTSPSPRVFSAVQPTGALHLGNYLGALRQFRDLQESYDCVYCIADLHAITQPHDPRFFADATHQVAAAFLACGIDHKKHIVFAQSAVSAHAELAWILNCTARMGWLDRMTQFKEKAGKSRERASVGLYVYPVLMAADILAYHATHVPVGDDQRQHLELARAIAQKFNSDFMPEGEAFFPLPEACILGEAARVMSLKDGTKKMSKSDPSEASRILMTDDAQAIAKKIRRAKTDALPLPESAKALQGRAEAENLLGLLSALSGETMEELFARLGGQGFSALKNELIERLVAEIVPIGDALKTWMREKGELQVILKEGAEKARAISAPILQEARRLVGFSD